MIVEVAVEAEWPLACRLAVGGENPVRAALMLQLIRSRVVDPRGLWLARRGGLILGAISAQVLPGGGGVLLPPRSIDAESRTALLLTAVEFLFQSGCETVHCAWTADEPAAQNALLAGGFNLLGDVGHYVCDVNTTQQTQPKINFEYSFVQYYPGLRAEFRSTVLRSYLDSRDFPELQVSGSPRDPLLNYTAGHNELPLWWLLQDDSGSSAGVVMLAENGVSGSWEMAYLGVVPEARRQGVGSQLITRALLECTRRKIPEITLCVDSRNSRAIRLYARHGFRFCVSEGLYLLRRHDTN